MRKATRPGGPPGAHRIVAARRAPASVAGGARREVPGLRLHQRRTRLRREGRRQGDPGPRQGERFGVQSNGDPASFTAENLARFRAVVFLDTTGSPLNAAQEAAFEEYFRAGGGFVGVGSAVETEPDWQFLTDILGTRAASKLGAQTVTNKVADRVHDASKNLPEYWNLNDTYYNWTSNVRGLSHVLTTVSDAPFDRTGDGPTINALTGGTMGADHPVTWCKDYQGGRSYYTNHGASAAAWNDANLAEGAPRRDHVGRGRGRPGLQRLRRDRARQLPADVRRGSAEPERADRLRRAARRHRPRDPDRPPRRRPAARPGDELDHAARDDPGLHRQRGRRIRARGRQRLQHEQVGLPLLLAADGQGREAVHRRDRHPDDPGWLRAEHGAPSADQRWDPYVGYFQLSRFKFVEASGGTPAHLDLATEQEILRVPNNRGACCHVAGDIDFDSHNNLWLVTGDDTPAGGGNSGGFAPFNDQLTNESQTIAVANATGGTFTLTFDGQTTAPIPFPLVNADDRGRAREHSPTSTTSRSRGPAPGRSTSAATSPSRTSRK